VGASKTIQAKKNREPVDDLMEWGRSDEGEEREGRGDLEISWRRGKE